MTMSACNSGLNIAVSSSASNAWYFSVGGAIGILSATALLTSFDPDLEGIYGLFKKACLK